MCHAKVSLQKFFHAVLNVQVGLFRVFSVGDSFRGSFGFHFGFHQCLFEGLFIVSS